MPTTYSYKVRVLAAIDAFYHPNHATPIRLTSIDARYKRDCDSHRLSLPLAWRKRVKLTIDKLVSEGWIIEKDNDSYLLAPKLRKIIADEKTRLEVYRSNHDWKTVAAIAKMMELSAPPVVTPPQNSASSSIPAGRTRRRTSLAVASPSSAAGPSSSAGPSNAVGDRQTQPPKRKKIRHSDPGPILSRSTPPVSSNTRKRTSIGSSSVQQTPAPTQRTPVAPRPARRRSSTSGASRIRRRHTLAVHPVRQEISFPAPISKEIQFYPLKQALSARTRRALRRNALSEEMNNIDEEQRAGQRRNREELAKLRAELAQNAERLRELERELLAARYAPSEEPEPMPSIREEEEHNDRLQDEDCMMDYAPPVSGPVDLPTAHERRSQSAEESGKETPVTSRDKKIRDLEAMIERLRENIKHREQEAAIRAQEEEVFHDAEEQIMLEENNFLMGKIQDLESVRSKRKGKAVTFEDANQLADHDLDDCYMGPTADDFDDISDAEDPQDDMPFPSSGVDSGIVASSQTQAIEAQAEIEVAEVEVDGYALEVGELKDQNRELQRAIDRLTSKLREMEEEAEESQIGLIEREGATKSLKLEVETLKKAKKHLSERIMELEEMEGERLESMRDLMVQTDEAVDEETQEMLEGYTCQVLELEGMVNVLETEKRTVRTALAEATAKIAALETAVEVGERTKEGAASEVQDLKKMVALLEKENSIMTAESDEMKTEIVELKGLVARLEKEVGELRVDNAGLKQEVDFQTEKNTDLQRVVSVLEKDKTTLRENVQALEREVEVLGDASNAAEETKARLEREISNFKAELSCQINATSAAEQASKAFQNTIFELRVQIDSLQKAVETSDSEKRTFAHDIVALQAQIADLRGQLELAGDQKGSLKNDVTELNTQIDLLQKAIQDANAEKARLQHNIQELQAQVSRLEDEQRISASQKESLGEKIAELNAHIASLVEAADASSMQNSSLQLNIKDLQAKVSDFEAEIELANDRRTSLEEDLGELNAKVSSFQRSSNALSTENLDLRHEVGALRARISEVEGSLRLSDDEKKILENNVAGLNTQIDSLRQAAEASNAEKTRFQHDIQTSQDQVLRLNEALEAAVSRKKSLDGDIAELKAEIDSLQRGANVSNAEKAGLQLDIGALHLKVSDLEAALKLSDDKTMSLENNILELEAQIESFKQVIDAAGAEKEQMETSMSGMMAQIHGLTRASKVAQNEKEDLDRNVASLRLQINHLEEERDAALAENGLLKQDIASYKEEISSLTRLLDLSNQEKESLTKHIEELEEKVGSLEATVRDANGDNSNLRTELDTLNAEIRTLKQASAIADEERSVIQQKIRPYLHGEQSLDMAVDEVLTELVIEKNRADENERVRDELFKKIKILAREDDDRDIDSFHPEEIVEKLTDRFREVRSYIENLYTQHVQSGESPFEGHNLDDFAWTGSNENSLKILGGLVGGLYEKVNKAHAQTKEMEKEKEKEKAQCTLYGRFLDDIATSVGGEGRALPARDSVLEVVTLRLSNLRRQIETTEEKVEELNESIVRKNNTIKAMETDIEEAGRHETDLNKKLVEAAAAHEATTLRLDHAHLEIEGLNRVIDEKDAELGVMGAEIKNHSDNEHRLLQQIEKQASEHGAAVRELDQKRNEAVTRLEKLLEDARVAKTNAEHLADEQNKENKALIRKLEESAAGWKAELRAMSTKYDTMTANLEMTVKQLETAIAQGQHTADILSDQLHQSIEKSKREISALETQLKSSQDEIARQELALKRAVAERNRASRQLEAEIQSSQDVVSVLENKIAQITSDANLQRTNDHKLLFDLRLELEAYKAQAERERRRLQASIDAHAKRISDSEARVKNLEELLEEAEDSEAALEESLKASESQLQLFTEESEKAKEALEREKNGIMHQLTDLRVEMEKMREDMECDISALRTVIGKKEVLFEELETVANTLQGEKVKLTETVDQLEEEQAKLEAMLETEQQKSIEAVQALANEATKFMSRFGHVKDQFVRENKFRQVEGKKINKRAREEDEEAENDAANLLLHAPPTPTSTVAKPISAMQMVKHREHKRRKHDSGIGVEEEEDDEEQRYAMTTASG